MQALEKLFGGQNRIKLLRFFLLERERLVSIEELSKTLHMSAKQVLKEGRFLEDVGFIKTKKCVIEIAKGKKTRKRKTKGFVGNHSFPFLQPLFHLLIAAAPVSREKMHAFFNSKKTVALVVLSGIFLSESAQHERRPDIDTPIDVLVVAKKGKKADFDPFMGKLGAEIGKELDWAFLTTEEYEYRKGIHDKFLRDIFDYSHEVLLDREGIRWTSLSGV